MLIGDILKIKTGELVYATHTDEKKFTNTKYQFVLIQKLLLLL